MKKCSIFKIHKSDNFKKHDFRILKTQWRPCGGVCTRICLLIGVESPAYRSQAGFPWKRLQVVNKTHSTGLKAGSAKEQLRLLTVPE